jgi:hypothetical protein
MKATFPVGPRQSPTGGTNVVFIHEVKKSDSILDSRRLIWIDTCKPWGYPISMSILFFLLIPSTYAELPQYLSNIPKTHVCEKNLGVSPIELSVGAALRFIANGNQKVAEELGRSNARTAMLTKHEELCENSKIKNTHDYMKQLIQSCESTCRGTTACLRVCNNTRDVQLVYLEGALSGLGACPAPDNSSSIKSVR